MGVNRKYGKLVQFIRRSCEWTMQYLRSGALGTSWQPCSSCSTPANVSAGTGIELCNEFLLEALAAAEQGKDKVEA
jgi:hypothetical protein